MAGGASDIRFGVWVPLVAAATLVVCVRVAALAQEPPARTTTSFNVQVWDFASTPLGPMRAIALVPRDLAPAARLPLLIAMHGSGEADRGVERGAWGWARDYEIGASDTALRRGDLTRGAFFDLIDPARLTLLRRDLARRAYGGMVIVTPYTPNFLHDAGVGVQEAFDTWVAHDLIVRARSTLPVIPTREATGIDGVSLGGLESLWIGLGHPDVFGAVGALQAAVQHHQADVAGRYVASPTRPAQRIRLTTSDRDPLRPEVLALSDVLRARGVVHDVRVVRGPHDYIFNRGPGGIEMLLFHDRALRGEPAP